MVLGVLICLQEVSRVWLEGESRAKEIEVQDKAVKKSLSERCQRSNG